MDFASFKLDIDELIDEFAKDGSTSFDDMKRVWLARKFSFIFEAHPGHHLSLFMQSLYSHTIGYMLAEKSLSYRLGGLYTLYCLYEIQPFKPPFKIYISLEQLKLLKDLVVEAKKNGVKAACAVVKKMLESNVFLFGFVDLNEQSFKERVDEITDLQNTYAQIAFKRLLGDSQTDHFLHMDMGMELDLQKIKILSEEYAKAKEIAIKEASEVVDVQNIKHIAENGELIGDKIEKIAEDWNIQRGQYYDQTGLTQQHSNGQQQQQQGNEEHGDEEEDFDIELEKLLSTP